jgi:RNA polymerase sigma-70 factor (ECF subfamily)
VTNAAGDAELLADVAAGDQRAAAALFDTYAPMLYGYGLHRLRDPELAEELVQRVLWTLCRRAARYDPERGPVRAYVFAIAGSTVVDLRRQAAGTRRDGRGGRRGRRRRRSGGGRRHGAGGTAAPG